MKYLISFLLPLIFVLGACGNSVEPSSPVTVTASVSAGPTDAQYLSFLKSQAPALAGVSDQQLLEVSQSICNALSSGTTLERIRTLTLNSGFDPATGGTLVGAAIEYDCPQYAYLIDDLDSGVNS